MEPKKPAVAMWLWITLIIVVLAAGGFFAWYYLKPETSTKNSSLQTTQAPATTTTSQNSSCDLSKVTGLTPGTTWDILGGEDFSTAVCGYLKTETVHNEMDDVTNDIASLVITSYKDAGFKTAIEKVVNEGNTVNSSSSANNSFSLGCYANGQITYSRPNELSMGQTGTIDAAQTTKLKNATATNPVAVKLEFFKHAGSGCNCCNLAENVIVQ